MKCWVGFGSNVGDRRTNFEEAAKSMKLVRGLRLLRASPVVENPALLPEGAPEDWRKPFLNAVVEIEWDGSPNDLLSALKKIEAEMGRGAEPRWSPRAIDLDLLTFGYEIIQSSTLNVPHAEMWKRQFVLTPLKHLAGSVALKRSRDLAQHLPLWMGIINLTPDSFADEGRRVRDLDRVNERLDEFDRENIQIVDFGAESTRPGARPLTADEEWRRLKPALDAFNSKYQASAFHPWLSVDTYHASTAARAVEAGADIINDVSGLASKEMLDLLRSSRCQYILMHSLTVPANPKAILQAEDPVATLLEWAGGKLKELSAAGVDLDRVVFDPGIGFGKTAGQALTIIQNIDRLFALPVRVLVGHSRKSFMKIWSANEAPSRDPETLGVSLRLAERGVDILRVHEPALHQRVFRAFSESR